MADKSWRFPIVTFHSEHAIHGQSRSGTIDEPNGSFCMVEYRDKIPAARGKVEYIYEEGRGISASISHSEPTFHALYQVALSIDGTRLLCTVPAGGLGQTVVAPQPSVLAFVQSDVRGMWGRNCPACEKYFRSEQIMGDTTCPYCSAIAPDLAFVSNDQKKYLTACYDAFANAYMKKQTTSVDIADITDEKSAWHYSEEKQQLVFKCQNTRCNCRTDVLGEYAFCPRCGRSNARERFLQAGQAELVRLEQIRTSVTDRHEREIVWEQMTTGAVSRLEALAKHLRKIPCLVPYAGEVAEAIVKVVDTPFGKRPFRVHIDPSQDGAEVTNMVMDRVRAEMLRRIGLEDVLTPRKLV